MLKIVADNKIPFLEGALEPFADVTYFPGGEIDNEKLKEADALVTRTRTKCNEATLQCTSVKLITSATIGFDHIDTDWCETHQISWTNAPGCNSESVKQYVAAILALLVEEQGWQLANKAIAVVGVGNVGSKVSALAQALGMTVYEVDPPRARHEGGQRFYQLDDIIDKADIITFHTPLTKEGDDQTYHLCDRGLLSRMKPGAVVINSSRGEVINGTALKEAIESKQIGQAVLDVWENEPEIDSDLLDKVWIATPHIAGYSQDGKAKGTEMSVRAVSRFFKLGIDEWEAQNIPQPEEPEISIDCKGLDEDHIIATAILHTYPIKRDDTDLRGDVSQFEYLRGAYPVRREFHAYEVVLHNGTKALADKMKAIGFREVIVK
ncbi:4-phosphoerythronate dehydrogenase PdxB [Carboxylicivirga sediminis]|uniref:Erythronate-4-phosphate dehydrogenase n=1 Tax=Carboxylicivirga sediminis TaxID=2006564 RepID=A0A941IWR4_9BACT|nr:4-phosphoerythronate dehydrogenase PdxB [Carboxylicivirga sediminis]MBR8534793.1 4-phosphoerythronate dehydrogenase PdxB [Carboxylicivirga sediminis]